MLFLSAVLAGCTLPDEGVMLIDADGFASVGNVDGRGRSDHAVLKIHEMSETSTNLYYADLHLYTNHRFRRDLDYGSQDRLKADAAIDLDLGVSALMEHHVTTAGDLDGDGLDEVAFTACYGGGSCKDSMLQLIFGRSAWEADTSASDSGVLVYTADASGAPAVEALGDVDGDGLGDLLITGSLGFGVGILPGSADRWGGALAASDFVPLDSDGAVSAAGDLNGDGIMDLLIQAFDEPPALAMGSAALVSAGAVSVTLSAIDSTVESPQVQPAGDLNCDGLSDLLLYADESEAAAGLETLEVLLGQDGDLSSLESLQVQLSERISVEALGVGEDLDGDGCADMVIATPDELLWLSGVELASGGTVSPYQRDVLPDASAWQVRLIDDVGGNGVADIALTVSGGFLLIDGS